MHLPIHLLALQQAEMPWRKAVCGAISVGLPMLIAYCLDQPYGILFGAIGGLYASFLDFGGTFRHRASTQAWGLALIFSAGIAGNLIGSASPALLLLLLAMLCLGVGWIDGTGVALETIARFVVLAFLIYAYLPAPPWSALIFAVLGIAIGLAAVGVDSMIWPRALPRTHPGLVNSIGKVMRGRNAGWTHALGFSATTCAAMWLALDLHYTRPAWVTAVTLFVIRPDGPDSLRRLFQTAFGTLAGAAAAWCISHILPYMGLMLVWVTILAFLRPLAVARNQWAASAVMTAMILLLFDIVLLPAGQGAGAAILRVRLNDAMLGAMVALIGVALFNRDARRHLLAHLRD
ncbi:FUSC family protein [Chitiniphilus eburneus]|uniref:FUSC family protein n=1 Tax=Chitiniphilus eburneus TaxID=2571148 RepID=A0A4U0Q9D8_9NEIS|nr:FUSC family protein [Chitiniphilus eburneus]TJZ77550.1 FUSC family protein [Chitiniphilus eburneus]